MEEKKASFQRQKTIEQKKNDKKIIKVVNLSPLFVTLCFF